MCSNMLIGCPSGFQSFALDIQYITQSGLYIELLLLNGLVSHRSERAATATRRMGVLDRLSSDNIGKISNETQLMNLPVSPGQDLWLSPFPLHV